MFIIKLKLSRNCTFKLQVTASEAGNLKLSAIYQLCQSMPGTAQLQGRDKQARQEQAETRQGQAGTNRDIPFLSLLVPACPCLSMLVPACPCQSLSVPVCPFLSLYVPVCLYICYIFMSSTADECNSLHQYEHSYIDFPCHKHCSNACKPCF